MTSPPWATPSSTGSPTASDQAAHPGRGRRPDQPVEANDGRGDQDAYDAAWSWTKVYVRRHHPRALMFSLDAVAKGERGISATYPPLADGSIPHYVGATPEPEGHRQQLWTEGTDPNGHLSSERGKTMFRQDEEVTMPTEAHYVAGLALRWAAVDPMEQWINPAPEGGPTPLAETIGEYLGSDNPFPDGAHVEVVRHDGGGREPATVIDRTAVNEWTVEYDDGEQVWRDHQELRPHFPQAG